VKTSSRKLFDPKGGSQTENQKTETENLDRWGTKLRNFEPDQFEISGHQVNEYLEPNEDKSKQCVRKHFVIFNLVNVLTPQNERTGR